jgi:hypothetical protein
MRTNIKPKQGKPSKYTKPPKVAKYSKRQYRPAQARASAAVAAVGAPVALSHPVASARPATTTTPWALPRAGTPPAAISPESLVTQADPADVARLCDRYGLRRDDLGRLTGFSLRALADWAAGKLPSEPAKRRLHEIRRLLDALAEVVDVKAIAPWLRTRNPAFESMTPLQVIEVGEIDRLWQMVHHMGSDSID